jgi:signal peptidase I
MKTLLLLIVPLIITVSFAGLYKTFTKSGEKGWKSLIPVYNIIVLLKIIRKPPWYVVFLMVPIISSLVFPYILIQLYGRFGIRKFGFLLPAIVLPFIYLPLIGFSNRYSINLETSDPFELKKDLRIWAYSIVFAIFSVLFIKGLNIFFFQNYKLPTGAMEKSILIGDYILVNKFAVGPRLPITPIAFPFYLHTVPVLNIPSYISSIKLPYIRLAKSLNIKRNDIVVFNYPEGDTVIMSNRASSYYSIIRNYTENFKMMDLQNGRPARSYKDYYSLARNYILEQEEIIFRPIDRRDNYIKRCVALPGDSLKITNGKLYLNGKLENENEYIQYNYSITTDGSQINPRTFEKLGIYPYDVYFDPNTGQYRLYLSNKDVNIIKSMANVKSLEREISIHGQFNMEIFPHDTLYKWNQDNFGPIWIPKKGTTVGITKNNLCLYERIISAYEGNKLEIKDETIYINDKPANTYTFKMDYYFMMGDNRHNSLDSRFWGFVPEDHITAKASFIWMSISPEKKIRWERIFMDTK